MSTLDEQLLRLTAIYPRAYDAARLTEIVGSLERNFVKPYELRTVINLMVDTWTTNRSPGAADLISAVKRMRYEDKRGKKDPTASDRLVPGGHDGHGEIYMTPEEARLELARMGEEYPGCKDGWTMMRSGETGPAKPNYYQAWANQIYYRGLLKVRDYYLPKEENHGR